MRPNLTLLRPAATRLRHVRKPSSQPPGDATPPVVATPPEATHPETPQVAPGSHPATRATRPRRNPDARVARRDQRDASKVARRDSRVASRAALRKRASALVSQATGRHYERTGFATSTRRVLAYALLICVMGCVAYMGWTGEYDWAHLHLGWTGFHAGMAPGALDAAAVGCSLVALDLIDRGESGLWFRFWSAVLLALGAWINWRTFLPSGDVTKETFFPVMSIVAYSIVHGLMAAARRQSRRLQHGLKSRERVEPLPRLGALVWVPGLGQPSQAWQAWREAVALRLAKALALSQLPAGATPGETSSDEEETSGDERDEDEADEDASATPDLSQMRQADAIRWVFANVPGADASNLVALRHLRDHGWPDLKPQRVADGRRRSQPATSEVAPETDATEPVADDATG